MNQFLSATLPSPPPNRRRRSLPSRPRGRWPRTPLPRTRVNKGKKGRALVPTPTISSHWIEMVGGAPGRLWSKKNWVRRCYFSSSCSTLPSRPSRRATRVCSTSGNPDELRAGEAFKYLAAPGVVAHGRLEVDHADPRQTAGDRGRTSYVRWSRGTSGSATVTPNTSTVPSGSYGSSRPWTSAGGLVASTAVKGSRITYVCDAPFGTVQESPAARGMVSPPRRSSARPPITYPTVS